MNQIDLDGRVAVVTGGAQGIGYAIAERMLASGAAVALWDPDGEQARRGQGHARRRPAASHADVVELTERRRGRGRGGAHDRQRTARSTSSSTTPASPAATAPTWELAPDVWRRVIEVNLVAPYLVCRADRAAHDRAASYGRIVNIASVAGKEGNPNASHYSASKAGLIALTKSLGKELATKGVLVNAVTPAAAKTAIFDHDDAGSTSTSCSRRSRWAASSRSTKSPRWSPGSRRRTARSRTGAVFDLSGGRATY